MAATFNPIIPLPIPDPPELTVSQLVLVETALHATPAGAPTEIAVAPLEGPTLSEMGETDSIATLFHVLVPVRPVKLSVTVTTGE